MPTGTTNLNTNTTPLDLSTGATTYVVGQGPAVTSTAPTDSNGNLINPSGPIPVGTIITDKTSRNKMIAAGFLIGVGLTLLIVFIFKAAKK